MREIVWWFKSELVMIYWACSHTSRPCTYRNVATNLEGNPRKGGKLDLKAICSGKD